MKWLSHRYRFVDGRSAGADERRTGRGPHRAVCETEQLNYRIMHSGAGHDAQLRAARPYLYDFRPQH